MSAVPCLLAALLLAPTPAQDEPAAVTVDRAVKRKLAAGQVLVGSVLPARRSVIGSAVDARVVSCEVDAGDAVKKKVALVQLQTGVLQIELRAAKAELKTKKSDLLELQNGARPEEIAQSASERDAAAAILKSAKSRYERSRSLFKQKAINDEQLQSAMSSYEQARATLAALTAKHALLTKGARVEQIDRAKAMVEYQDEQINLIEDRIKRHTIIAPFDGYVSRKHTEVGEWIKRGDPVIEVVELSRVEIEVFLIEKYLGSVRLGSTVRIEVPSVPGTVFTGKLTRIVPQADTRARTFPIRIEVQNKNGPSGPVLKSGMLARVPLPVGDRREVTLVPKDALVLGGREPIVFVVAAGSGPRKARAVPVRIGVMDDTMIEVTGAVKQGDFVVIRGNEALKNGDEVVATAKPQRSTRASGRAQR